MRHGQGYHSSAVTPKGGQAIRDPYLTQEGEKQCNEFCHDFGRHDQIDLLLASPLRRALQTCALCFAPCVERGPQIVALPLAEEASSVTSDTGVDRDVLVKEFPNVDFDHVKHGWYVHENETAIDPASVNIRAAKLRRWIRGRPEREVVLVSHGYFCHYMTGDVNEKGEQTTPSWEETELRTFTFVTGDEEDAMIEESRDSMLRRGTA